jgi:hypothetical protein
MYRVSTRHMRDAYALLALWFCESRGDEFLWSLRDSTERWLYAL